MKKIVEFGSYYFFFFPIFELPTANYYFDFKLGFVVFRGVCRCLVIYGVTGHVFEPQSVLLLQDSVRVRVTGWAGLWSLWGEVHKLSPPSCSPSLSLPPPSPMLGRREAGRRRVGPPRRTEVEKITVLGSQLL